MRYSGWFLVACTTAAVAQPPSGYYSAAEGLSGEPLRQALSQIISPHTVVANSAIWQAFELTDRKSDGTVWDIYSDVQGGSPLYVYQFVLDQCGTYDSEGDCFNREHTFPQSWYDNAAPMSTDLFHLMPTDAWVNQQRGNLPYATVGAVNWSSANGSKRGTCSWPGCSGTVFEPIDAYKGDIARNFFYMATRYLPLLPGWSSPMMSGVDFLPWAEEVLVAWHELDPVSTKEVDRNNAVFGLQGNRNPFIDRPEWVAAIWGPFAGVPGMAAPSTRLWYHEGVLYCSDEAGVGAMELEIRDASGRLLQQERSIGTQQQVFVDLPHGVYLAALQNSSGRAVLRFVH